MSRTIYSSLGTLCTIAWWLVAVPASVSASDGKSLIEQAYSQTEKARTLDDFNEILRLCGEAEQAGLAKEQTEYLKSLQAWALNRRGEFYTEQATAAHDKGQIQEASQLDAKALADFEASLQLDATRWKTWHNRAVGRAIAGKYQEAIADFGKVLELKPDYANAWFNRGEIHYDLGMIPEAIEDYTESIRLNSQDAGAYSSRAHAYFRSGQAEASLADFTKAIELSPGNVEMLANRGEALQGMGKWLEAAADFNAAIKIDPESPRVLQGAAWLMATCPEAEVRNAQLAVQAAERAVQLAGKSDARYLDTLAAAYANANRFPEALTKVTEALQLASSEQAVAMKKRLALYQQKQPFRQTAGEKTAAVSKTKKAR